MRQINICFLTCLNLSVTDKFENTHALCTLLGAQLDLKNYSCYVATIDSRVKIQFNSVISQCVLQLLRMGHFFEK